MPKLLNNLLKSPCWYYRPVRGEYLRLKTEKSVDRILNQFTFQNESEDNANAWLCQYGGQVFMICDPWSDHPSLRKQEEMSVQHGSFSLVSSGSDPDRSARFCKYIFGSERTMRFLEPIHKRISWGTSLELTENCCWLPRATRVYII